MLHAVANAINTVKDIFHKFGIVRTSVTTYNFITTDSKVTAAEKTTQNPGFFGKIWQGVKKGMGAALDVVTSPSFGRAMVITSAIIAFASNPVGGIAAAVLSASALAAVGIGVGIGARAHMRLRDAQLEHSLLKELEKLHSRGDRGKEILDKAKDGKNFSGEKELQERKPSKILSYLKAFQNNFAEATVGIASAALSGNIPFLVVTSASAAMSYKMGADSRVKRDQELLALKSDSDRISNELGLNTSSKGRDRVNQLLELYNKSIPESTKAYANLKNFADVKPVSVFQAVKDTVVKGFSATEASNLTNPSAKNPYEKENIPSAAQQAPVKEQPLQDKAQASSVSQKPEVKETKQEHDAKYDKIAHSAADGLRGAKEVTDQAKVESPHVDNIKAEKGKNSEISH